MKRIVINSIIVIIILSVFGCNDNNEYIPFYQDAIYVMDADGDNKQKVIDMEDVNYVKFVYTKDKMLYLKDNELYTINIDGTDNTKISGDIEVKGMNRGYSSASVTTEGKNIIFTGFENDQVDLFVYDVDDLTLTNITETASLDEYNPRFSSDNEKACFITAQDSIHHLCVLDFQTLSIDTLYTSNGRIPGCIYSIDNDLIYFIEESTDTNRQNSFDRDSYRGSVSSINIQSLEISILDEYSSNNDAHSMDVNANYLMYRRYSPDRWITYAFDDQSTTMLDQFGIEFIDLNENDQILFSEDSTTDMIWLVDIGSGTIEEIATDAFGGSYNLFETKICYIGQYEISCKKSQITN